MAALAPNKFYFLEVPGYSPRVPRAISIEKPSLLGCWAVALALFCFRFVRVSGSSLRAPQEILIELLGFGLLRQISVSFPRHMA